MRSRSQPARVVSFTVYVPGSRSPLSKGVVPSAREKSGSEPSQDALKPNVCGSPGGNVTLSAWISASFSFVHVHFTVSPATRVFCPAVSRGSKPDVGPFTKRKWANRPITNVEPEPPVRTQPMRSRSQPANTVSFTVYVPGSRSPLSKGVVPSAREKSGSEPSQDALKPNVCGSPGGNVTLSAWIFPDFVFVYVHSTVSPGAKEIVTVVSPTSKSASLPIRKVESVPSPPSSVTTQSMSVSVQPVGGVSSVTSYSPRTSTW